MARPREPIELVVAKGKKNLTKAEIEERRSSELQPCTDDIVAPSFLTAKQKREFDRLSGQLKKLKIMGETDCDTLARYIAAQELYTQAIKDLRTVQKQKPKGDEATVEQLVAWAEMLDRLDKRTERYFKQASTAARDLGLTISSRCKLVVPIKDEPVRVNKFSAFSSPKSDSQAQQHLQ